MEIYFVYRASADAPEVSAVLRTTNGHDRPVTGQDWPDYSPIEKWVAGLGVSAIDAELLARDLLADATGCNGAAVLLALRFAEQVLAKQTLPILLNRADLVHWSFAWLTDDLIQRTSELTLAHTALMRLGVPCAN